MLYLLAFANDGTLKGMNHEEISSLLVIIHDASLELGLKFNVAKTQYMVVDDRTNRDLFLDNKKLEKVKSFKYSGSIISDDGSMEEELKARIAKAGSCFGAMVKVMCNRGHVSLETKLKVLKCVLIPVLMYASETWNLSKAQETRLDVIEMRWLRSILGLNVMDFIPNCDIRLICGGIVEVSRLIEKQRLKYLGHIIRMDEYDPDSLQNLMYFWTEPWHWFMMRGRPPTRWVDGLNRSLYKLGLVKEVRKVKRKDKEPGKKGRPRKSELEKRISIFKIVDWTLVEMAARDKDEWRVLTLKIEEFDVQFTNTRIFATDSSATT